MPGVNVVGVQFRRAGRIYSFNGKNLMVAEGDSVVVETERGATLAEVKRVQYLSEEQAKIKSLKPVIRVATEKDLDSGRLSEERVLSFTKDRVSTLKLDMSVIGVEVQLGGNKVIVFFTAPGRVDFRELVKDLAGGLKTRIELKQVGARDEAKLVGGLGMCGREYCCSSFLREFVPVSIKMAKNQNLALNPSKVSGGCGRLLCCLTYEDDVYKELQKKLPPRKAKVRLEDGREGIVLKSDILGQKLLLELESGEQLTIPLSQVEVLGKHTTSASDASHDTDDEWGSDLDLKSLMGESEKPQTGRQKDDQSSQGHRNQRGERRGSRRTQKSQGGHDHSSRESEGDIGAGEGASASAGKRKRRSRNRNRNRSRKKTEARDGANPSSQDRRESKPKDHKGD